MMGVELVALEAQTCEYGCDSKGLAVGQANNLGRHVGSEYSTVRIANCSFASLRAGCGGSALGYK